MILVSFLFDLVLGPSRSFCPLPPAPCRECINMDDFNKSPCLLASGQVPPMSSTCKKPGAQRRRVGASIPRTPSLPGYSGSAVSLHRRPQRHTAALPGVQYLLTLASSLLLKGRVVLFLAVSLHSASTFVSRFVGGFLLCCFFSSFILSNLHVPYISCWDYDK